MCMLYTGKIFAHANLKLNKNILPYNPMTMNNALVALYICLCRGGAALLFGRRLWLVRAYKIHSHIHQAEKVIIRDSVLW